MNKLLISDTGIFAIIGTIIGLIILYYAVKYIIKNKKPKDKKEKAVKVKKEKPVKKDKTPAVEEVKSFAITINEKYMLQKELKFQSTLNKILPSSYIAFPRVGVDNLISPRGTKNDYNSLMSKYVDFCIFECASMKPLLVIDLYDDTFSDQELSSVDKYVVNALNYVNIPILPIRYEAVIDEKELQTKIKEKLTKKD